MKLARFREIAGARWGQSSTIAPWTIHEKDSMLCAAHLPCCAHILHSEAPIRFLKTSHIPNLGGRASRMPYLGQSTLDSEL